VAKAVCSSSDLGGKSAHSAAWKMIGLPSILRSTVGTENGTGCSAGTCSDMGSSKAEWPLVGAVVVAGSDVTNRARTKTPRRQNGGRKASERGPFFPGRHSGVLREGC
jgi:hypothetical protein